MKRLTCEMCGSTNLIKQEGVFVCQDCGTKYSVEEAKKMMIEGTVDVSGSTVKVDTEERLENLYQVARRAKDENNFENAGKYYDMILMDDPTSWEAYFYSVFSKAMQCKIAEIPSAAVSVTNCEANVLTLITTHITEEDDQIAAISEVVNRCSTITETFANAEENYYQGIPMSLRMKDNKYFEEHKNAIRAITSIVYTLTKNIESLIASNPEISGTMMRNLFDFMAATWTQAYSYRIMGSDLISPSDYLERIKIYDSDHDSLTRETYKGIRETGIDTEFFSAHCKSCKLFKYDRITNTFVAQNMKKGLLNKYDDIPGKITLSYKILSFQGDKQKHSFSIPMEQLKKIYIVELSSSWFKFHFGDGRYVFLNIMPQRDADQSLVREWCQRLDVDLGIDNGSKTVFEELKQ